MLGIMPFRCLDNEITFIFLFHCFSILRISRFDYISNPITVKSVSTLKFTKWCKSIVEFAK